MGMQLPGWLVQALNYCGYSWPSSDESKLMDWAGQCTSLSSAATTAATGYQSAIDHVKSNNSGEATASFSSYMDGSGNLTALRDLGTAGSTASVLMTVASGIILTMKLAVIAQLAILAAAIAGAVVSLGIGTGAAIAARELCKRLINAAINLAVEQVLGGGAA